MINLLVNFALLAFNFWLAYKRYEEEKYESAMLHSFGVGVHFSLVALTLMDNL